MHTMPRLLPRRPKKSQHTSGSEQEIHNADEGEIVPRDVASEVMADAFGCRSGACALRR